MHFKKMKSRREKSVFSGDGYQWEVGGHREGGLQVSMVDVFCFHILK
jgi:hypothetical protein